MGKITVEISGESVLILSGVTFHPDTGKICINVRGSADSTKNVVVPKGKTARYQFDVDEMELQNKITEIKVQIGEIENKELN